MLLSTIIANVMLAPMYCLNKDHGYQNELFVMYIMGVHHIS